MTTQNDPQANAALTKRPRKSRAGPQAVFNSAAGEFDESTMLGLYPDFAKEVRRILKVGTWNEISARKAGYTTRINHVSIAGMLRGDKPGYGLVVKFAQAMGANVNLLLRLLDYPEFKIQVNEHTQELLPEGYKLISEDALPVSVEVAGKIEEGVLLFPEAMREAARKTLTQRTLDNIALQTMRLMRENNVKPVALPKSMPSTPFVSISGGSDRLHVASK